MRGIVTGMDRVTINDVASLAGVSKKTVSRVINHSPLIAKHTRETIERIIAETGFVPNPAARALALKRSAMVALVHDDPLSSALAEVQAGMATALRDSEFVLCVHFLGHEPKASLRAFGDFLEYHRPAAVLLVPPLSERDDLAGLAWEYGCRCARLGAVAGEVEPGWVATPERRAASDVVDRLVEAGHRRIAFISGREDMRSARLREMGYLDAMAGHGLDRGPSLIAQGDGGFEAGRDAARLLLELSPRPTAIFAASDDMAAAALHAACEIGLAVPEELSIVGFGDSPLSSQVWPPLTTVRVPLLEMAHAATVQLLTPDEPETPGLTFPAEFIERASCAPVQAGTGEPSSFAFQSG